MSDDPLAELFDAGANPTGTLYFDMDRLPAEEQQALRNLYRWAFPDDNVVPSDDENPTS